MAYYPTNMEVYRKRKGMSQGDLAKAIGKHQAQVSNWEGRETRPSDDVLAAIAEVLNCDADMLLRPFDMFADVELPIVIELPIAA